MKRKAVRFIVLLMAGSVFLFSGVKVFKYRLELRNGAEYADTIAQMVITPNTRLYSDQAAESLPSGAVSSQSAEEPALESAESIRADKKESLPEKLGSEANTGKDSVKSDAPAVTIPEPVQVYESVRASEGILPEVDVGEDRDVSDAPKTARSEEESTDDSDRIVPAERVEEVISENSEPTADSNEAADDRPVWFAPIQVDFDALRAENQDVVAWLYCPDTPINYPVVQGEDNEYYMHRLLDGRRSYAGTLFMDYRNSSDFSDWNSVIYGHNMRNNSMFGTLTDYKMRSYAQAHPEIFLLTPNRDYVIRVLTGLVTSDSSELYNALRPDDERKDRLLKEWLQDSGIEAEDYPAADARLVALSTCSYEYNNARYVVIGVLEELAS